MQYGSIAAGSVFVFLAILVGVNWISNRQNKRWDLTESKVFSLSDQTKQILSSLKGPLHIRVFYAPPDSAQSYRDRLESYDVPVQAGVGRVHQRRGRTDRRPRSTRSRPCRR